METIEPIAPFSLSPLARSTYFPARPNPPLRPYIVTPNVPLPGRFHGESVLPSSSRIISETVVSPVFSIRRIYGWHLQQS